MLAAKRGDLGRKDEDGANMAFGLTQNDPDDGRPWVFRDEGEARNVEEWIRMNAPRLLIGSAMCAAFSQMRNINLSRVSEEDARAVIEYGARHLEFCTRLYRIHARNRLDFCTDTLQAPGVGITKMSGMCSG